MQPPGLGQGGPVGWGQLQSGASGLLSSPGPGSASSSSAGLLPGETATQQDHREAIDAASEVLMEYIRANEPVEPTLVAAAVGSRLAAKGLPADVAARAAQSVARAVVQRLGMKGTAVPMGMGLGAGAGLPAAWSAPAPPAPVGGHMFAGSVWQSTGPYGQGLQAPMPVGAPPMQG